MTEPTITPNISDCQFQKSFIQIGLFPEDGIIVLLTNKESIAVYKKEYRSANTDKIKARDKAYRKNNLEKIKAQKKIYHEANRDRDNAKSKAWQETNPEKSKILKNAYYAANKEKIKEKGKIWSNANPEKVKLSAKKWVIANPEKYKAVYEKYNYLNVKYNTYKNRLQKYENITQNTDGTLMVGCAYCGKLYAPTRSQVNSRISAINGTLEGENRFYCSQPCKTSCPTYKQVKYYRFQKIGYTREVPTEFRQIALLDRNYTCENCSSDESGLHVHHIIGYTESPMTMADLSNVKVLCANCHKAVHSIPGCLYVDYSCKNQK